jgi:hypothetical protein
MWQPHGVVDRYQVWWESWDVEKRTKLDVGMEGRQLNRNKRAPIGTRKNSGIWYLKGGGRSTPSNTTQKSARVVCWQQRKAEITPATAVWSRGPQDLMRVPAFETICRAQVASR